MALRKKGELIMNKKNNHLNLALIITGLSILVLGAVLVFTLPQEIRDGFWEKHTDRFTIGSEEWNDNLGKDTFRSFEDFHGRKPHGAIGFFLLLLAVPILFFGFREIGKGGLFRHGRYSSNESSIDILRRSYAEGRMTREEYLKRKKTFEEEGQEV
jgi:hypothetical protein